jgi:hypothetical protein
VSDINNERIKDYILELYQKKGYDFAIIYEMSLERKSNIKPEMLRIIGLGNLVDEKNQDRVYPIGRSRERDVIWFIKLRDSFYRSGDGTWCLTFVSPCCGRVLYPTVESLKNSIDSEDDHFKVDAFIELLNIMDRLKKIKLTIL